MATAKLFEAYGQPNFSTMDPPTNTELPTTSFSPYVSKDANTISSLKQELTFDPFFQVSAEAITSNTAAIISTSIGATTLNEKIGPYRRVAIFAIVRRTFLKHKCPKQKRRFRCYAPGFLQLPIATPSRCWPVLTAEEEEDESLRQKYEWERARDTKTSWVPQGGW